jgi:hypothetical protein
MEGGRRQKTRRTSYSTFSLAERKRKWGLNEIKEVREKSKWKVKKQITLSFRAWVQL